MQSTSENIISFDVGTRNLALCILNYDKVSNKHKIIDWTVRDIEKCFDCESVNNPLQIIEKNKKIYVYCQQCEGDISFKKATNIQPKMQIVYFIQDFLNKLFFHLESLKVLDQSHRVIIEDQPYSSKINRDMIYVQDTIISYFALKNIRVQPVQAKIRGVFYKNSAYKNNKKNSMISTQKVLEHQTSDNVKKQLNFWLSQAKRDDFADSLIQSLSYVQKNMMVKKNKKTTSNLDELVQTITIE